MTPVRSDTAPPTAARGRARSRSRAALLPLLLVLPAVLSACGGSAPAAAHVTPVPTDTLVGEILVTGADPTASVELRTADERVRLVGPVADTLRSLSRVEVAVTGERVQRGLRVRSFRVVGVAGVSAMDGVLELDRGDAVLLVPTGERVRYGPAPPGLRPLVGRRVWIAGPAGVAPSSWGVIEPTS